MKGFVVVITLYLCPFSFRGFFISSDWTNGLPFGSRQIAPPDGIISLTRYCAGEGDLGGEVDADPGTTSGCSMIVVRADPLRRLVFPRVNMMRDAEDGGIS